MANPKKVVVFPSHLEGKMRHLLRVISNRRDLFRVISGVFSKAIMEECCLIVFKDKELLKQVLAKAFQNEKLVDRFYSEIVEKSQELIKTPKFKEHFIIKIKNDNHKK